MALLKHRNFNQQINQLPLKRLIPPVGSQMALSYFIKQNHAVYTKIYLSDPYYYWIFLHFVFAACCHLDYGSMNCFELMVPCALL